MKPSRDDNRALPVTQLCRRAWRASAGFRGRIVAILVTGILRVAASLLFIWLSKLLIDTATNPASTSAAIWQLAALLALSLCAELALSETENYIASITRTKLANALRRRLFNDIIDAVGSESKAHSGDTLNRLTVDIPTLVKTLVDTLPSTLIMAIQLVAAFILLWSMSTTLALCALVITPIFILGGKIFFRRMRRLNADIRDSESHIHAHIQESIQHRVVIQSFEAAPQADSRLADIQQRLVDTTVSQARLSMFSRSSVRMGFVAGYLIAFVWSIFQLHSGAITFGVMTAFMQLVGRIQGPISSLSQLLPSFITAATAVDRLSQLTPDSAADHLAPITPPAAPCGIKIENLSFAYVADEPEIYSDFSHDFAPGSLTALVGRTGIGKTTLIRLLLGLVAPSRGSLAIYSGDRSYTISAATRSFISYVPQGNSLLAGTIRDNLLLGDPSADDAALLEALHTAAADFVADLPAGLDTRVGESGANLSEGQCQRIAIARALLRRAPILLLDEFNSSLDPDTARTLTDNLLRLAASSRTTVIAITHRPDLLPATIPTLTLK